MGQKDAPVGVQVNHPLFDDQANEVALIENFEDASAFANRWSGAGTSGYTHELASVASQGDAGLHLRTRTSTPMIGDSVTTRTYFPVPGFPEVGLISVGLRFHVPDDPSTKQLTLRATLTDVPNSGDSMDAIMRWDGSEWELNVDGAYVGGFGLTLANGAFGWDATYPVWNYAELLFAPQTQKWVRVRVNHLEGSNVNGKDLATSTGGSNHFNMFFLAQLATLSAADERVYFDTVKAVAS